MPDVRRARFYKQQSRRPCVKPTALPSPTQCRFGNEPRGTSKPQWGFVSYPASPTKTAYNFARSLSIAARGTYYLELLC